MKIFVSQIVLTFMVLFFSCKGELNNNKGYITIIPVAEAVGTGEILNLSDYAKFVEYIPLASNDSILIGRIGFVRKTKNKYIVFDNPFNAKVRCLLFDESGNFVSQLGRHGQGPGEYITIKSIDVDPLLERILIDGRVKCFEYDFDGNLIRSIPNPIIPADCQRWETALAGDKIYFSTIVSPLHRYYKAVLFNSDSETTSSVMHLFPNSLFREKERKGSWGSDDGRLYRFRDNLRYWRSWDDSIMTLGKNNEMNLAFVLDMGKYKAPIEWSYSADYATTEYIQLFNVVESKKYLFLAFRFGRNAPEKFEVFFQNLSGKKDSYIETRVNALFDKETGELILLNQPVKHKYLGFKNDLDGGPCFWPQYISSDDKMVTWWNAEDFLEIYNQLENPSPELQKIAEKLTPEDNPVLMVVTLK